MASPNPLGGGNFSNVKKKKEKEKVSKRLNPWSFQALRSAMASPNPLGGGNFSNVKKKKEKEKVSKRLNPWSFQPSTTLFP
jgi:hypothetical protein